MNFKLTLLVFLMACGFSSCYINRDFMLQADSDFVFDQLSEDSTSKEFRIGPNSILLVNVFTNDGALLLEYSTGGGEGRRFLTGSSMNYIVDSEGNVDLPLIGKVNLNGKTIPEAQRYLGELYDIRYNDTYVVIKVESRRVIVYNGNNSSGKVVPLTNNGISILEAITLAGGMATNADAGKVRLFRRKDGEYKAYQIDLSKIDGIKYANTAVESGDIIYVQPVPRIGREILENIQPAVSIISSASIIYLAFTRIF
jgi:polysaccharide export outer membrane protein